MEPSSNLMENNTSVDGSSFKSDETISKSQTGQRHRHSKAHSRSKEFEGDRRMSSASKRTLAQMTQSTSKYFLLWRF